MKFYYCSGFICLLMSMNVVSLFPTLCIHVSRCVSWFHGSPSFPALPFHALCPQLAEQAGPWDNRWEGALEQTRCAGAGHLLLVEQSGLRTRICLDVESSEMGVHFCLSGFGPWACVRERCPCCRDSSNHLLFV